MVTVKVQQVSLLTNCGHAMADRPPHPIEQVDPDHPTACKPQRPGAADPTRRLGHGWAPESEDRDQSTQHCCHRPNSVKYSDCHHLSL
jgi:hypothetical protein